MTSGLVHVVAGNLGEVGSALQQVLTKENPQDDAVVGFDRGEFEDLTFPMHDDGAVMLHVAIPWSPGFEDQVEHYSAALGPGRVQVVVHSTVVPGVCDQHGWTHSPVRGRHPRLVEGIRTFTKHFGGRNAAAAAYQFAIRGIPCQVNDRALDTELGKLVELASFGVQVRVMREVQRICEDYKADFNTVYTAFSATYNQGYSKLGEGRFVRPVLEYMPGPLGGHCVARGTELLDEKFFNEVVLPMAESEE